MWADELCEWYNQVDKVKPLITIADGSKKERKAKLAQNNKFTIINYAMLRDSDYGKLFNKKWDLVVADEAHKLKNRKTQQTQGFQKLTSKRMALLTGSPLLNSPEEIWSLLNILFPSRFGSYWQFVEDFCQTEYNPFAQTPKIIGVKNKRELHFLVNPLMINRKKEDVLADLPDKRYQTIKLKMDDKQEKIYRDLEENMFADLGEDLLLTSTGLEQLLRLKQIALSPQLLDADQVGVKIKTIKELLNDTDKKVVIFSRFASFIELLAEKLNHKFVKITGEVDAQDRRRYEKQFQDDPQIKVFLGTIGSAGEGLNLQSASIMIFADKAWSPKVNEQCEDRVHRPGQTDSPLIISLICKNTVDEDLELTLKNKNKVINETLALNGVKEKILQRM